MSIVTSVSSFINFINDADSDTGKQPNILAVYRISSASMSNFTRNDAYICFWSYHRDGRYSENILNKMLTDNVNSAGGQAPSLRMKVETTWLEFCRSFVSTAMNIHELSWNREGKICFFCGRTGVTMLTESCLDDYNFHLINSNGLVKMFLLQFSKG